VDQGAKVLVAVVGGILIGVALAVLSFWLGFTMYLLLAIVLMILVTLIGGIFYLGRVSSEVWWHHRKKSGT
jgi:hypothetical protein